MFCAPRKMLLGSWERLREPDSVVIDLGGYNLLFPGELLELGEGHQFGGGGHGELLAQL